MYNFEDTEEEDVNNTKADPAASLGHFCANAGDDLTQASLKLRQWKLWLYAK